MTTAHVAPVMVSDDRPHELGDGACWCQPVIEDVPPTGRLVLHRRFMDGPVRMPDDTNDGRGWFVTTVGDDPLALVPA